MRWKYHLRGFWDEIHLAHDIEKFHFVLIQRRKTYRNIRNHLNGTWRVKIPYPFRRTSYIVHVCPEMTRDNKEYIVA